MMNASMDAADLKGPANKVTIPEGSRSMDELDGPSPLTVDVIDGSSIGPRFGNRGMRKVSSSSSSNQSSNCNEPELTLLPSQTYPDYPDFGAPSNRDRNGSVSRMETVFDVDSAVYTRMSNNVSMTSLHSQKKKEKDWYETSLDSPIAGRKFKPAPTSTVEKLPSSLPPPSSTPSSTCSSSTASTTTAAAAATAGMSNGMSEPNLCEWQTTTKKMTLTLKLWCHSNLQRIWR